MSLLDWWKRKRAERKDRAARKAVQRLGIDTNRWADEIRAKVERRVAPPADDGVDDLVNLGVLDVELALEANSDAPSSDDSSTDISPPDDYSGGGGDFGGGGASGDW